MSDALRSRAAILLDVDGVLNPAVESGRLVLAPERAELVRRLDESAQIVWASTWGRDATLELAADLGLRKPSPALAYPAGSGKTGPALRWIARGCPGLDVVPRALAWIDDALDGEAVAWAESADLAALLVRPDPATGLTADDVARVEEFVREHSVDRDR